MTPKKVLFIDSADGEYTVFESEQKAKDDIGDDVGFGDEFDIYEYRLVGKRSYKVDCVEVTTSKKVITKK